MTSDADHEIPLSRDESLELDRLEAILAFDPGGRGSKRFWQPGDFLAACQAIAAARRVVIVTGFWIYEVSAAESDGPLGAATLAGVLEAAGKTAIVLTDEPCLDVVRSVHASATTNTRLADNADLLISVERPGRAADGCFYNMKGVDISPWTAPLDALFLETYQKAATTPATRTTIGIGDGGNEIGMGKVDRNVLDSIPYGRTIGTVVGTDCLIPTGVSNWAAWALAAVFHDPNHHDFLQPSVVRRMVETATQAGAVDGVTKKFGDTMDGLPWEVHAQVLSDLIEWSKRWARQRPSPAWREKSHRGSGTTSP